MDYSLNRCLVDLDLALQSLEDLRQQGAAPQEVDNCLRSLSTFKASLIARLKRKTPLKWLRLRTGIYNPERLRQPTMMSQWISPAILP